MQEIRFFVVAFLLCWKCGRCTTQRPQTIHRATKPPYIPSALGGRLVTSNSIFCACGKTVRWNFSHVSVCFAACISKALDAFAFGNKCAKIPADFVAATFERSGFHNKFSSSRRAKRRSNAPAALSFAKIFSACAILPTLGAACGRW